jgi:hypothetical protein
MDVLSDIYPPTLSTKIVIGPWTPNSSAMGVVT